MLSVELKLMPYGRRANVVLRKKRRSESKLCEKAWPNLKAIFWGKKVDSRVSLTWYGV